MIVGKHFFAEILKSTRHFFIEKLRNTLVHEMCHAASWLVNKVNKPPHGNEFKYW